MSVTCTRTARVSVTVQLWLCKNWRGSVSKRCHFWPESSAGPGANGYATVFSWGGSQPALSSDAINFQPTCQPCGRKPWLHPPVALVSTHLRSGVTGTRLVVMQAMLQGAGGPARAMMCVSCACASRPAPQEGPARPLVSSEVPSRPAQVRATGYCCHALQQACARLL